MGPVWIGSGDCAAVDVQASFDLVRPPQMEDAIPLAGVDLFAGIGGMSAGFAELGVRMQGVDAEAAASAVYASAGFGTSRVADLRSELIVSDAAIVVGGPPCRPWSAVNLQRRAAEHGDHGLLGRFVDHVEVINPLVFVMENVPALRSDEAYTSGMERLQAVGYDVAARLVHYDRFGAATRRRRLVTVGIRGDEGAGHRFFELLARYQRPAASVRDAIFRFRGLERNAVPDHEWSLLQTIHKYRERYATGQFGWRKLDYDEPAPSFGSVAKTYILHPEAGVDGFPERVLSVREVMAIMGFPDGVRFPEGVSRTKRYQMAANSVSPQVSQAIAKTVLEILGRPLRDMADHSAAVSIDFQLRGRGPR